MSISLILLMTGSMMLTLFQEMSGGQILIIMIRWGALSKLWQQKVIYVTPYIHPGLLHRKMKMTQYDRCWNILCENIILLHVFLLALGLTKYQAGFNYCLKYYNKWLFHIKIIYFHGVNYKTLHGLLYFIIKICLIKEEFWWKVINIIYFFHG